MPSGRVTMDLRERFERAYTPEPMSGCWLWTGDVCRGTGYGRISSINSGRREIIRAHRLSYELHVGPIPAGMMVCHRCDNRACVNPQHLFVGSALDNVRDMDAKHRRRTVVPVRAHPKGSQVATAKLSESDVLDIRRRLPCPYPVLAAEYGVDRSVISKIATGRAWRHCP